MTKSQWAANLILDSTRKAKVDIRSSDLVRVTEYEGETPIAETTTTEPALLSAILIKLGRLR